MTDPSGGPEPCQSCGAPEDELTQVERLYLDPDGGAPEPGGIEWWCVACRATYPHRDGA